MCMSERVCKVRSFDSNKKQTGFGISGLAHTITYVYREESLLRFLQINIHIRGLSRMRINGFILYCSLVLLELLVLVIPGDDAYVKISVPTAFALISAAVKLKAVWLKAYMGLKSMGHRGQHQHLPPPHYYAAREHFSYGRFKRSAGGGGASSESKLTFNPDDLMNAWNELEKASQRKLKFDEASCAKASDVKNVNLSMWSQLLQSEFSAKLTDKEYSALVSSLIGSLAGDPRACQFTRIITASLMMKPEPVAVDFEEEGSSSDGRRR